MEGNFNGVLVISIQLHVGCYDSPLILFLSTMLCSSVQHEWPDFYVVVAVMEDIPLHRSRAAAGDGTKKRRKEVSAPTGDLA